MSIATFDDGDDLAFTRLNTNTTDTGLTTNNRNTDDENNAVLTPQATATTWSTMDSVNEVSGTINAVDAIERRQGVYAPWASLV